MPVPVALIGAAKLKEVPAFDQREVISNHMILAVPEARTHVLGVKVIGCEHVGGSFAKGFQSAS